jgi:hypothetical protein
MPTDSSHIRCFRDLLLRGWCSRDCAHIRIKATG